MRLILALAALSVSAIGLSGCFFHHKQQVSVMEPAPPPVYRPLK